MAIAPGAPRLLVILFDGFRQREMNHRAHRGLVDAQSESDRADQHANFVGHPHLLVAPACSGIHPAVIGDGGDSLLLQKIHRLFHARNRGRIDDHVSPACLRNVFSSNCGWRAARRTP